MACLSTEGTTPEPARGELRAKAKVCLVGANTGCKTNLIRRHVLDEFDDRYILTVGAKVTLKRLRLAERPERPAVGMDLTIWDILSHREFRRLLREAYAWGASGIVAVADMTRRATYDELDDWIQDVENVAGNIPIVVVGANRDPTGRQEVSEDDLRRLAEAYGASCFFASANSGESVEEALLLLAERIAARRLRRGGVSSNRAEG